MAILTVNEQWQIGARVRAENAPVGAYKPAGATNGVGARVPHRVRLRSACSPLREVGA